MKKVTILPASNIEIINHSLTLGNIHHALFDFDGTISLIREGWQAVMIPMMVEILMQTPLHESQAEIEQLVKEFITRLTGKQTVYQMIQLAEEIEKRGGTAKDPLHYKHMYHDRLMTNIEHRISSLKAGKTNPQEMIVPGSFEILQNLKSRGVCCYLASGTDEVFVLEEAELLGITGYFKGIYGAQDDYINFSKKMIIERIIRENSLSGSELVAFGDGYVEIEDTKAVGGIGVGVASNEAERTGIDDWKRSRLIAAGADLIIPDFQEQDRLLDYLFEEE
jgi:phosphoglycolate phosphatase-like HAD superfamily hydrolase